jgi:DNA polymerase
MRHEALDKFADWEVLGFESATDMMRELGIATTPSLRERFGYAPIRRRTVLHRAAELHLDWETYSEADLTKVGAHKYAQHKSSEILCAAYAFGNEEPQLWFPDEPCPQDIIDHVASGGEIHAWNANFERLMWKYVAGPKYGWPVPELRQYRCIMVRAMAMNMPAKLDHAAPAFGLPIRKDTAGSRIMLQLCKPRKPTKKIPGTRFTPENAPEKFKIMYDYCLQDVRVEQGVGERAIKLIAREQELWFIDQEINDRGIMVDMDLVAKAERICNEEKEALEAEMRMVTDMRVNTLGAVKQLKEFVNLRLEEELVGITIESCDKETLESLLGRDDIPVDVRRAVSIRLEAGKASIAKLAAFTLRVCDDGTIKGSLQYHGATQTGRWAARGVQLQNLPKPDIHLNTDVHLAIKCIKDGWSRADIAAFFGPPISVVADCLRGMLMARPGRVLRSRDLTGIEARMLPWLAGAHDAIAAFFEFDRGTGADNYKVAAAQIYNIPVSEVTKDQRQVGKVAVLALGFGGGAAAFAKMAKVYRLDLATIYDIVYGIATPDNRLKAVEGWKARGSKSGIRKKAWLTAEMIKLAWREANHEIVQFWYDLEEAAINAVENPGKKFMAGEFITFNMTGSFLRCKLPSGRSIFYPYARVEWRVTPWGSRKPTLIFKSIDSFTRKWAEQDFYGGKASENVTQAAARDVMANAIIVTENAGYENVLSVHDEGVAETDEDFGSEDEFHELFTTPPAWALPKGNRLGLPIAASGWSDDRYKKE